MKPLRYILLLVAVGVFGSCKRNEIYYPPQTVGGVAVRINMLWPRGGDSDSRVVITPPAGFYACFFPKNALPFVDYLDTYGGVVNLYHC